MGKEPVLVPDKIHAPEPLPPLDLIFQEAWQISFRSTPHGFSVSRRPRVSPSGWSDCYMYICAIAPPPEEIIGEKAGHFEKRVFYVFEHYEELWDKWLTKFKALGEEMKALEIPAESAQICSRRSGVAGAHRQSMSLMSCMESFDRLVNMMIKGWQYHFEMLNLTYLAYLMFADVARKLFPGISESAIGKMVAGAYVSMFRPEEELCRLSGSAHEPPDVARSPQGQSIREGKNRGTGKDPEGKKWLAEYEKAKDPWFYVSCGSGWFHHEGSWIDTPGNPLRLHQELCGTAGQR